MYQEAFSALKYQRFRVRWGEQKVWHVAGEMCCTYSCVFTKPEKSELHLHTCACTLVRVQVCAWGCVCGKAANPQGMPRFWGDANQLCFVVWGWVVLMVLATKRAITLLMKLHSLGLIYH